MRLDTRHIWMAFRLYESADGVVDLLGNRRTFRTGRTRTSWLKTARNRLENFVWTFLVHLLIESMKLGEHVFHCPGDRRMRMGQVELLKAVKWNRTKLLQSQQRYCLVAISNHFRPRARIRTHSLVKLRVSQTRPQQTSLQIHLPQVPNPVRRSSSHPAVVRVYKKLWNQFTDHEILSICKRKCWMLWLTCYYFLGCQPFPSGVRFRLMTISECDVLI